MTDGTKDRDDRRPLSRDASAEETAGRSLPTAGPHADPALTDPFKTPGAGTLPPADDADVDAPTG